MPKFIAALLAVLLLAGCSPIPLLSGEFRITAEELTEKMAVRFPLEKSVAGLLDVTLVRPRVELLVDQQRIVTSFDVNVKLVLSGKRVAGTLKISARPEYVAASRSLFLRDARVDQIRIDNMPDALSAALAKAASNFGKDAVEDKPLYVFKPEELTRHGVRFEPERIEVKANTLVLKVK